MLERKLLALTVAATVLLGACRFTGSYEGPGGAVEVTGQLDPRSGAPANHKGKLLGTGRITLEDGTTYRGKFYDTDGDSRPDKFLPDADQSRGTGHGATNGVDWYDLEPGS